MAARLLWMGRARVNEWPSMLTCPPTSINEQEARIRRGKIQKEADFYGAMDGATKIVKGDAVMSLIITLINFVGGVIIGVVMGGRLLQTYSIVTIGDKIRFRRCRPCDKHHGRPAMIVTRSVSEGSLNRDAVGRVEAQPRFHDHRRHFDVPCGDS